MTKHPKRPRDPAQLAKLIVDIATGESIEAAQRPLAAHCTAILATYFRR